MSDCLATFKFKPVNEAQYLEGYRPGLLLWPLQDRESDESWMLADRSLRDLANWNLQIADSDGY